ncbi:MAG: acyl-CoA-binding protein [Nevskia sp.]|nr:acyl-CoA-binding protein [Nevskia sp.]
MNASAQLFEPHSFRYGEHRLYYETVGAGPPIVLLHGILLDSLVNRELATRFAAEGFQVILLDLLGHGRSDKTRDPKDYRTDFFADQVIALLDHLGIGTAIVGGVSLGCIVSLHVAVHAPQRVRALFLEMPVMEWSAVWAALLLSPLLVSARLGRPLHEPFARFVRRLPRPRGLRQQWLGSVLDVLSLPPPVLAAILHGTLVGPMVPSESQRRKIQAPALVIGHARDKLHEFRDAHALAHELPHARLLQARHILELRTRPERLWPQIAEFFKPFRETAPEPAHSSPAPAPAAAPETPAADPELHQRFAAAVARVRSAPAKGPFKPDNALKLKMYALYRQATDGDAPGKRPGALDPVARFKYDAWAALKGMAREEAMRRYVEEVEQLEKRLA